MKPSRIAILASGEGTTAESFIRAGADGKITAQAGLVICNNAKAGIFDRVHSLNQELGLAIETTHINGTTHPALRGEKVAPGAQTASEETAIMEILKAGNFDAIVLMGYMKRVGPLLVHAFGWRPEYTSPFQAMMLNTHPGLLPETKGLYGRFVQEHVLEKDLPFGGQTLHVVAEDYDDGPVIAEHQVATQPGDTPDTLFDRVKAAEKQFLPADVDTFIKNRLEYLVKREV
jgi:phosphoribosylglycinamide formyltransferase-1